MPIARATVRSVGEISLHDPREFDVGPALEDAAVATVDMAALRALARETEIDFTELRENVNRTLEGKDGAPASATVADVLELHPATQGVASVVGLLDLGVGHGIREAGGESVTWSSMTGRSRRAQLDRFRFTEDVPGGVTPAPQGARVLPADYVTAHVELAYASTAHGVQGDDQAEGGEPARGAAEPHVAESAGDAEAAALHDETEQGADEDHGELPRGR